VFARYTSPVESMLCYRIWDVEVPLALSGTLTSQVRLDPGSWVFGDMDGVLVIPEDVVEEVLTKAEEAKEVEDKVRAEIRRGMPVKDVEAKYGRL
jgi:4-hydroxy-4-methyl-2-oxoglutarate aldolase